MRWVAVKAMVRQAIRGEPLWQSGSTLSVRLQFVPQASGGAIGLDDFEIDPYSKR